MITANAGNRAHAAIDHVLWASITNLEGKCPGVNVRAMISMEEIFAGVIGGRGYLDQPENL